MVPTIVVRTIAVVFLIALAAAPAGARRRAVRTFDAVSHGVNGARAMVEDGTHTIWAADGRGLLRFDGARFVRAHDELIVREVVRLVATADGVVALDRGGELFAANLATARRHSLPTGGGVSWLGPAPRGLLAVSDGRLWRHGDDRWIAVDLQGVTAPPRLAAIGPDGTLWLGTDDRVWRVAPSGTAEVWRSRHPPVVAILPRANGEVWISDFLSTHVWSPAGTRMVLSAEAPVGRRTSLVERGATVWVAYDHGLYAIAPGAAPEPVGVAEGIRDADALMVDHEGSLWVGGFQAVYQLPEPDTVAWDHHDDLPDGLRAVTTTAEAVWVGSWNGTGRLWRGRGGDRAAHTAAYGGVCLDRRGTPWVAAAIGRARWTTAGWSSSSAPSTGAGGCATGPDGRVWILDPTGLYVVGDDGEPGAVALPPRGAGEAGFELVDEGASGVLWVAARDRVCQVPVAAVVAGAPAWRCRPAPTRLPIVALAEIDGAAWIAVTGEGLFAWGQDGWSLLDDGTSARATVGLAPSPRGGAWRLGATVIERVIARDDALEIVERPTAWHGLPTASAVDAAEDPDGRLWLATDVGLVELPAAVRDAPLTPPAVRRVGVEVDGLARAGDRLTIAADAERVVVRVAADSWREPGRLRFRYRFGSTRPWSAPTTDATVTLGAPRPGRLQLEIAASLDERQWGRVAILQFDVAARWYQHWYVWLLAIAAGALVAGVPLMIRGALLRAGARQRLRIAHDLHDELGSGLGSIGLLAGILREPGAEDREELASRIATTATELGGSLGDLVWALRDGDRTIGEVAQRLVARARDLFADGSTAVRAELPEPLPAAWLSIDAQRQLLLLGLEALHNVQRHAHARTVTLVLRAVGRHRWELSITDDGRGLAGANSTVGSGLGLTSMRSRARKLGASLEVDSTGRGTRVAVTVRTRSAADRRRRWGWR